MNKARASIQFKDNLSASYTPNTNNLYELPRLVSSTRRIRMLGFVLRRLSAFLYTVVAEALAGATNNT